MIIYLKVAENICGGFIINLLISKLYRNSINYEAKKLNLTSKQLNGFLERFLFEFNLILSIKEISFYIQIYKVFLRFFYFLIILSKYLPNEAHNPNTYRVVRNTIGINRLPFTMPCNGVIKNDGFLGNYGFGLKLESEPIKLEAKRK
jgi:O6-methylguanine-DNA--protein-cysteine methyltransferase